MSQAWRREPHQDKQAHGRGRGVLERDKVERSTGPETADSGFGQYLKDKDRREEKKTQ